jgi:pimeloyl-ACP methyl ester carboxylesterase
MRFVFVHGGFHVDGAESGRSQSCRRSDTRASPSTLPVTARDWTRNRHWPAAADAIVSMIQHGDVLVGHSGGGFDATLASDAASDLVSHIAYLAAALPRERRTYPDAMAMRDNEEGEFDADVGEMLGYLKFDDDGAMWFADFDGAWKYLSHDCDEETAGWAFKRLGPERFGDTTTKPAATSG